MNRNEQERHTVSASFLLKAEQAQTRNKAFTYTFIPFKPIPHPHHPLKDSIIGLFLGNKCSFESFMAEMKINEPCFELFLAKTTLYEPRFESGTRINNTKTKLSDNQRSRFHYGWLKVLRP